MLKVSSSNIHSVGYSKKTKTLRVKFNLGATYDYYDVDNDVVEELLNADSIGKYLHKRIMNKYKWSRVWNKEDSPEQLLKALHTSFETKNVKDFKIILTELKTRLIK